VVVTRCCCQSIYEPGKRHWLKIKKDYLADGTMADTADLVVLGAYFGTGGKGNHQSIELRLCLRGFDTVFTDRAFVICDATIYFLTTLTVI